MPNNYMAGYNIGDQYLINTQKIHELFSGIAGVKNLRVSKIHDAPYASFDVEDHVAAFKAHQIAKKHKMYFEAGDYGYF